MQPLVVDITMTQIISSKQKRIIIQLVNAFAIVINYFGVKHVLFDYEFYFISSSLTVILNKRP